MALLEEYSYCYTRVAASALTLDPLDSEDIEILNEINSTILPSIQTTYDNAAASISTYYNNINANLMKKISGNATISEYRSTISNSCNFIRDLRNGVIFAKIKRYVENIITQGIRSVWSGMKQACLDAIADTGLMAEIANLDDICKEVNMALGVCTGLISQGTSFLNAISNCLEDTGLYNSNLATGVIKIKELMAEGNGKINDISSAINSVRTTIKTNANIPGLTSSLINKLENASYKMVGL